MKILGLDMSSRTGWSLFEGPTLLNYGLLEVTLEDFNVNNYPDKSPKYPLNILTAANRMAELMLELYQAENPDIIVVENSVRGKNRHTQRWIEWLHMAFWMKFKDLGVKIVYLDPSQWRKILEVKLSNEDKKNNKLVNQGKIRGKVTRKHLAVRWCNQTFNLALKLKDNNQADAVCLSCAYYQSIK